MKTLEKRNVQDLENTPRLEEAVEAISETEEEELCAEDIKITPLIKYVGKQLSRKKDLKLKLEGKFQYNLLSLLTRQEWLAAKTLELLAEAGFTENELYLSATTKGDKAFAEELKLAFLEGKVKLDDDPDIVAQVMKVIAAIVKYYTSFGDSDNEKSSDVEEEEEDADHQNSVNSQASANPARTGVADLLKQLQQTETPKPKSPPQQPVINPWTYYNDTVQNANLNSFSGLKTFLSKDLLRTSDEALGSGQRAFEVAQEMVASLVLADYNLGTLHHLVSQTATEKILPPTNKSEATRPPGQGGDLLYDKILAKLYTFRSQLPNLTDIQLEYLVKKTLIFVMRGCNKMVPPPKAPSGSNIVFNYLPPGLRELEGSRGPSASDEKVNTLEDGETPKASSVTKPNPEDTESTDPLNLILNPGQSEALNSSNELPKRNYLVVTVHTEWVMLHGKPQVYEMSLYASDLSSCTMYCVPEAIQKDEDVMQNLGIYHNKEIKAFFFAQKMLGIVQAHKSVDQGLQQVAQFLEEKRHSTTSKNNGIVLIFNSEEEMAIVLRAIERTGNKNLLLDVVKGFGCLEYYIHRHLSKKLKYGTPTLIVMEDNQGSFVYNTTVRQGLLSTNIVSKSKSEALLNALEHLLGETPNYSNFIQSFCHPSFSQKLELAKKKLKKVEEMFSLELFMAFELKRQGVKLYLDGIFAPRLKVDFRDEASILANRICRLLVEAGLDKSALDKGFKETPGFTINSSVFLDKIDNPSKKLHMTDQTMRCIELIRQYYRPRNGQPS